MNQPKTIIITGASDGIGAAAARRLHGEGHRVVIVGRSPRKTRDVARELGADHYLADFARLEEVRALAAELKTAYPRIDVLANNAGGIFGDRAKTVDGFEKTFQVNHLAPFLLTRLLMDALIAGGAAVIQTASSGARFGKIVLDDLDHDRHFTAVGAYNSTKLENILFTTELHRRYHSAGISTAAFHPGTVATSFATESDSFLKYLTGTRLSRALLSTPEKGAEQLVWLAQARPGVDWVSGTYYEKHRPAKRTNPQARDADLARRLWERSEELLG